MGKDNAGFTLIEISIVLVIIGLVVGGVLVGQDLLRAAAVRAQITQIEKYQTAVNTFRGKFNALPGDMNYATAQAFGFNTGDNTTTNAATGCGGRTPGAGIGLGNGDGLLDSSFPIFVNIAASELGCFWVDLSSQLAGSLIEGSFASAGMFQPCHLANTATPQFLPLARIGGGNFVYVQEALGINYYGLANITNVGAGGFPFACGTTATGSLGKRTGNPQSNRKIFDCHLHFPCKI